MLSTTFHMLNLFFIISVINLHKDFSKRLINQNFIFKSQASDRKSNPHVSDLPCTAVSVKTQSYSFENFTKVFVSAENHKLTLKFEINFRNSPKSINFISIFKSGKHVLWCFRDYECALWPSPHDSLMTNSSIQYHFL